MHERGRCTNGRGDCSHVPFVVALMKTEIIRTRKSNKWCTMARNIVMVFNASFNNISAISCLSVLLVEETGGPGENHTPVASHWQTLSHNVISRTPNHERDSNFQI